MNFSSTYSFFSPFILLFFPVVNLYSQNWQTVGDADYPVTRIYADSSENVLYIGGAFKHFNSILVNGIARWDGMQVFPLGMGRTGSCGPNNCFDLVLLTKYGNEHYIGLITDSISGVPVKGIARWNGSEWLGLKGGLTLMNNEDGIPYDGYIYEGRLLIGGAFEKADSDTIYSFAAWDGLNWAGMNVPASMPGFLHSITCISHYKGDLYIAGNFVMNLDGEITHDIAVLKNGAWHKVEDGLKGGDSFVNDMIVFNNELYICGYFHSASGNVGNKIMRWDGEQWKDVMGGLCSPLDIAERMMVYNGKLYVVGIFDCVSNGVPASCIATWDGEQWCSFGNSKFNNKIRDVSAWNDNIYIGGGFTEIDSQPVKYFAKWIGDHATDTCSTPVVAAPKPLQATVFTLIVSPNPAHSSATISLEGEALSGKSVRFCIFNPLGQEVFSVTSSAGRHEVSLAGWSPGVYVVRAELERNVLSRVFVKE